MKETKMLCELLKTLSSELAGTVCSSEVYHHNVMVNIVSLFLCLSRPTTLEKEFHLWNAALI
jgi:hypothetical protein